MDERYECPACGDTREPREMGDGDCMCKHCCYMGRREDFVLPAGAAGVPDADE